MVRSRARAGSERFIRRPHGARASASWSEVGELGVRRWRPRPGRAHEVGAARHELVGVRPRRGAQAAADPVAHDRAADPAADGVRDARRLRAAARRPRRSPSRHLDGGAGPGPARETLTAHESARSGRQAGAALGPATAQHRAAGLRPHPQAEAVLLASLAVVRLERPLHAWPPRTPGPQPDGALGRGAPPPASERQCHNEQTCASRTGAAYGRVDNPPPRTTPADRSTVRAAVRHGRT